MREEESEEEVGFDETIQTAEGSESARTTEGRETTGKGDSAKEQVPQKATESGEQTEAEAAKETSAEEALPEQETEEIQTIETRSEAEHPVDENREDPQKSLIDLEEIEIEEKGKYIEALQEEEGNLPKASTGLPAED